MDYYILISETHIDNAVIDVKIWKKKSIPVES